MLARTKQRFSRLAEGARMRLALRAAGVPNAWRIRSFTTRSELISLYLLARACPKNAVLLEIGSYLGKSSCYLLAGSRSNRGTLVCVDTWDNWSMPEGQRDTLAEFRQNTRGATDRLVVLRKASSKLLPGDLPGKASLAFIDGDHRYEAVKEDMAIVETILAVDGIVAFHDVNSFEGVSVVVGEMLVSKKWALAGMCESLCWLRRSAFPGRAPER